jgi:hypothetical protein
MKNENLINGLLDNSEKGNLSGHFERLRGCSRGCTRMASGMLQTNAYLLLGHMASN